MANLAKGGSGMELWLRAAGQRGTSETTGDDHRGKMPDDSSNEGLLSSNPDPASSQAERPNDGARLLADRKASSNGNTATNAWSAAAKLLTGPKGDTNLATPIQLGASPTSLTVRGPSGRIVLEIGWRHVTKFSVAKVRNGEATLTLAIRKGTVYWFLAKERDLRRLSSWLEDIRNEHNLSTHSAKKEGDFRERPVRPPRLGSTWRLHHVREKGSHSAGFKVGLPSRLHPNRGMVLRFSARLEATLSSRPQLQRLAPQVSRIRKVLLPLAAMALLLGTTLGLSPRVHSRLATAQHVVVPHDHRMSEKALLALIRAERQGQFSLAPATKAPAPAPASLANAAPLARHEVFGFVPYWMLPLENSLHVSPYTTIAYFGVDIAPNGQLVQSGAGWEGYQSADLASLITRAHHDGVRVVLTAKCFDQSTLNALTHDTEADKVLAYQLALAIEAKRFDGVNLDLEGTGPYDRRGLVRLVGIVSNALHEVNPHWQVTMDVYASSASDPSGFFDVARLAPEVNAFFVMAYDMQDPSVPSPTAPLWGTKSFNDFDAVADYIHTVPSTKVILGVPFYGEEWQTSGPELGAKVLSGPVAVTYAQIAAANLPSYWDGVTQTAWTSFRYHGSWYQIDYDNPKSVALKANLAMFFHLRGIGVWALGMQGTNSGMTAALLGKAPPLHDLVEGPPGPLPIPTNPLPSPNGSGWLAPPKPVTPPNTTTPGGNANGSSTGGPCSQNTSDQPNCQPSQPSPNTPPGTTGPTSQLLATGFWRGQAVSLSKVDEPLPDLDSTGDRATSSPSTQGAGASSETSHEHAPGPSQDPAPLTSQVGTLQGFTTNDPVYACLENFGQLPVWSDPYNANVLLVTSEGPPPGLEVRTEDTTLDQITNSSVLTRGKGHAGPDSSTHETTLSSGHAVGSSCADTIWWFTAP